MEQTFLQLILGPTSPAMFAALLCFSLVGVAINLLIHSTTRDKKSPNTPYKFSIKFLLYDNWKRIVLSLLLLLVTIRFMGLVFDVDTGNQEVYLAASVAVGFGFDKLAEIWKARSSFLKVRE